MSVFNWMTLEFSNERHLVDQSKRKASKTTPRPECGMEVERSSRWYEAVDSDRKCPHCSILEDSELQYAVFAEKAAEGSDWYLVRLTRSQETVLVTRVPASDEETAERCGWRLLDVMKPIWASAGVEVPQRVTHSPC